MNHTDPKPRVRSKTFVRSQPAPSASVCQIQHLCQSCLYINKPYEESLQDKFNNGVKILKSQIDLSGIKVLEPTPSSATLGYRTHAKLAVRKPEHCLNPDPESRFAIGIFRPNSHEVVEISQCPLHRNSINEVIYDLKTELNASSLTPYDDHTHTGDLRYIAVRASHITQEIMLTFVTLDEKPKNELLEIVLRLRRKGHAITSSHMNINPEVTNVIFGNVSKRLAGADRLRERLCDLDFEIGPSSFFQVNPWQAEVIYRRIEHLAGNAQSDDVAWDLYCGTGQISLTLARLGYRTLGVELNPQATRDATSNAIKNSVKNPPTFVVGRVEENLDDFPSWSQNPKLVVVNPSRKGLDQKVSELLRDLVVEKKVRLFYMSCDVETLARDLAIIIQKGARVRQIEGYDMFPFTNKMEWLAVIS
jgi:23S rRNA (uracil1939-C5)-methyltransferase